MKWSLNWTEWKFRSRRNVRTDEQSLIIRNLQNYGSRWQYQKETMLPETFKVCKHKSAYIGMSDGVPCVPSTINLFTIQYIVHVFPFHYSGNIVFRDVSQVQWKSLKKYNDFFW